MKVLLLLIFWRGLKLWNLKKRIERGNQGVVQRLRIGQGISKRELKAKGKVYLAGAVKIDRISKRELKVKDERALLSSGVRISKNLKKRIERTC